MASATRTTLFTLLSMLATQVLAEDRWYAIEMVLFLHKPLTQAVTEQPSPLRVEPLLRQFAVATPLLGPALDSTTGRPLPFSEVASEQRQFSKVARSIQISSRYHRLYSYAWYQPGLSQRQAVTLRLTPPGWRRDRAPFIETVADESGISHQIELDGTVTVSLSRFLNIDLNLLYRHSRSDGQSRNYPIQTLRKIRSREIHYIDHPLVGIAIRAEPVSFAAE
ncbi:hypothetical protein D5085_17780 [Ectothiorhodospiraceae bacterium BW-2]|nr:hypothetical protein D5085_17780 [Ectothiorhodospiraceae bacterium BW-2]